MAATLTHLLARPVIGAWLASSEHSWRRNPVAADSPLVHAQETNPDRVLLTGDGAATGRGVQTHDLGLPGYLARSLSHHTARAADIDIVVTADMTARSCSAALADVDLGRFDIVVLSLGANEALALMPPAEWTAALEELLDDLDARVPQATEIFVLAIPFFGTNADFPAYLGRLVDRHVRVLNASTEKLAESRPRVNPVAVAQIDTFEKQGPHPYQRWAEAIAARISVALDPSRLESGDTEAFDELERQQALEALGVLSRNTDPVLDRLTETARRAFGTSIAAVTFIESDAQFMKSAVGMDPVTLPREEAFCDITIRRAAHFVIEDASLDSRFADYSIVTGENAIRFYAGYPIESPDGHRIGSVCVMDPVPRHFTANDAQLLRTLAHSIQDHLWLNTPAQPAGRR
jgi:hypothetical protein